MTTTDSDQGITLQQGTDPANLPSAQLAEFSGPASSGLLSRLNLRYASIADRTARHPVSIENEQSALADVDRVEVYNGTDWISHHTRALYASLRRPSDATAINNSTVLVNDAFLVTALPTAGTFQFRGMLFYDSSTTADLKVAFTFPAGGAISWGLAGLSTTVTAVSGDVTYPMTITSGSSLAVGGAGVGTITWLQFEGEYTAGGTAGNLQMQYAQQNLDATNTTIRSRSRMHVWRAL